MEKIDESTDKKTKEEIMEKCGRACALYDGDIDAVKAAKKKSKDLESTLGLLNQKKIWCGEWLKEGDIIYSTCTKCGCPLVRSGMVKLSPLHCYCSLGWVKSVFEEILGRPVWAELKKAIGRGDDICHFIVDMNK